MGWRDISSFYQSRRSQVHLHVGRMWSKVHKDWQHEEAHEDKPWDFIPNSWIKDVKETTGFRKSDKIQDAGVEYPKFIFDAIKENIEWLGFQWNGEVRYSSDYFEHNNILNNCSCVSWHSWTGRLRPPATAVLPADRRLPRLLQCRVPFILRECEGKVGS